MVRAVSGNAAARIDSFKNIPQLIAVANRLAARRRSRIAARLPHCDLMTFFKRHRHTAVFVSRSIDAAE